jgi:DNA-binding XRE family transcriptional regulator
MIGALAVAEDKKVHGGKRTGAGRKPKRELTSFGQWVESSQMAKKDVAEKLSISLVALYALISGKSKPSLDTAIKIATLTDGKFPVESWGEPQPKQ